MKDALGPWQAVNPAVGQSGAAAVATRDYRNGKESAHAQIFDSSASAILAAGIRAARQSPPGGGEALGSSPPSLRPVEVAGQPGFAEWAPPADGKVTLLIGDRFIVEIRGVGIAEVAELQALAGAMELSRLATVGR